MSPKAPPPPPPPPPKAPEPPPSKPPIELPYGVYRKELSEEQLAGFYECAYKSEEEMRIFLASVLGLKDHSYKARNGIIIDYFSGFAKEAELSVPSTFHVYKLSHDMLDVIKDGASFEEAEHQFKKLLLKLTIQQRKCDVPPLSILECHKIAPFFTTTVFQHYTLLTYCFSHDHICWFLSEQLWVETPLTIPLKVSFTQGELDRIQAGKEAAETAEVAAGLLEYLSWMAIEDILAAEDATELNLDALSPDEYVKARPETLEEAIERACRYKIEEAKKLFHNEYTGWEVKMLKKLVQLEVKAGIAAPPAPASGGPAPVPPVAKK